MPYNNPEAKIARARKALEEQYGSSAVDTIRQPQNGDMRLTFADIATVLFAADINVGTIQAYFETEGYGMYDEEPQTDSDTGEPQLVFSFDDGSRFAASMNKVNELMVGIDPVAAAKSIA